MADRLTASFNPAGGSRAAQISLWDLTLDRFAVLLLNPLSITFALLGRKLCGGFSLWSCKPEKLWSQTWPYIAFLFFFTDHIDSHSCRVSIFAGDGDSHQVGYCPGVATLRDLPAKWRHRIGVKCRGGWVQKSWIYRDDAKVWWPFFHGENDSFAMIFSRLGWFWEFFWCFCTKPSGLFHWNSAWWSLVRSVLFFSLADVSWCFIIIHCVHDVSWALW